MGPRGAIGSERAACGCPAAGRRLQEVTGALGEPPPAAQVGTRAHSGSGAGRTAGMGAQRRGRAHGGTAAGAHGGGPGRGAAPRRVFSSPRSDVIGGGGEPGGGGGGGAGRPPQVHVQLMKRHLTAGQDAREGARAGWTAAPPEPIAVAGPSMGERGEGARGAAGRAAAAPR